MNRITIKCVRYFLIAGLCLSALPAASAELLTPDEKAYLHEIGPILVCVDPDWYPFEQITRKGEYVGIGADILHLVMQRLDIDYHIVATRTWEESLLLSQQGDCDVISFLNLTPVRNRWLLFTHPTFSDPNVFITREEHMFIADPLRLGNERLVLPVGTSVQEHVRRTYPRLSILNVQTEAEAFDMVVNRQAEMTIRSLIMAAYTIKKEGLFSLKIAGQLPGMQNQFRMGVNGANPRLRDILNKAISTVTDEDRDAIVNKYISITSPPLIQSSLIIRVAILLGLVILVLVWRNIELNGYNRRLKTMSETDILTRLFNRMKIGQEFDLEVERNLRYHRDLSILMIDVDFFKLINDTYGHQTGDDVLRSVANILRETLRRGDKIGRWGGEEFLVLCPETNTDQATWIADRLRENVRNADLLTDIKITISIGVAGLLPEDTDRLLLKRADDALYQAKNSGRDQTRVAPHLPV